MKLEKGQITKIFLAAVFIALAAGASLLIKNVIDSRDPENSLPQMQVNAGYTVINPTRAGYEWNFLAVTKRSPAVTPQDLPLVAYQVLPGMPIVMNFSSPWEELEVSRTDGLNGIVFTPVAGEVLTPLQPGMYVYRVEASFKRGFIIYYFAVEVMLPPENV